VYAEQQTSTVPEVADVTTPLSSRDRREDKADAADDEVRWHFVRPESEQLHGVAELDRTKDEAIAFKFREP
jgi:hypothetical protein